MHIETEDKSLLARIDEEIRFFNRDRKSINLSIYLKQRMCNFEAVNLSELSLMFRRFSIRPVRLLT